MLMTLDNETLLGSYLAHIHSVVRRMSQLDFEKAQHPDYKGEEPVSESRKETMRMWESLRSQLGELLELRLKPFHDLAGPGSFHTHGNVVEGPRCLRWNFAKLKKLADKHRRKNPDFKLLKGWDLEAKRRTEDEVFDRQMERRLRRGL